MFGSAAIGALIAQVVFVILLVHGWISGELRIRALSIFILLWMAGRFALPYAPFGPVLMPAFVPALDIALVFIIFKGDVRLT